MVQRFKYNIANLARISQANLFDYAIQCYRCLHFVTTLLVLTLLLSNALLGLAGMPRRIPDYPDAIYILT